MIRKIFGLFAALLLSTAASAAITPIPAWKELSADSGAPSWPSPLQACQAQIGGITSVEYMDNPGWVGGFGYRCLDGGGTLRGYAVQTGSSVCPANSTLSGGACSCNSGFSELTGSCVPTSSTCPVGEGRTFNRTEGWARSANPDANDMLAALPDPPSIYNHDDGTCTGNLVPQGTECYRSQVPSAQGLYRVSCDYQMVITGPSNPANADPRSDPLAPPASCPGFVGQVNGKEVCVGTASSPLPADQAAPSKPTAAGNPSAGGKPATGPGSGSDGAGRTPSTGTGGNDGGPSGAAVGRSGTGDRAPGPETSGPVCGAPPLPSCNVKVDETGVPAEGTAEGRFSQGTTDLGTVETDAQGAFNDHRDIELPAWTWTFAFPTGCTPLILAGFNDFEIDVCQFQPMIHDLMSVLWVIAGIWGLIALFQRATGT